MQTFLDSSEPVTSDLLSVLQIPIIAELEGAFLRAFLASYGCYPICNNQSGIEMKDDELHPRFDIDRETFH